MTKLDKLKQAEHLYVYENQPLDVIGTKLDLSRRTLFYWKKEYDWDKKKFEKVLDKINNVLAIYINNEKLSLINEEILQDIKFDLIDLDVETKNLKSYYAEWSLLWIESIISLRVSEIKIGGIENGR